MTLNDRALRLADRLAADAETLRIAVSQDPTAPASSIAASVPTAASRPASAWPASASPTLPT